MLMVVSGDRDNTNLPSVLNKQHVLLFRTHFYRAFISPGYAHVIGQGLNTTHFPGH